MLLSPPRYLLLIKSHQKSNYITMLCLFPPNFSRLGDAWVWPSKDWKDLLPISYLSCLLLLLLMISPPTSSLLILPLLLSFGGGGKASSSVVVQSFQIITPLPPPSRIHAAITARRIDRDGTAINARRTPSPASAGYSITPSLLSSHPIKSKSIAPSSLFATADSEPSTTTTVSEEENFSEIKGMRAQVDEISSSIKEAKKRHGEVEENVGKLKEEKIRMASETEGLIDSLRNGLVWVLR